MNKEAFALGRRLGFQKSAVIVEGGIGALTAGEGRYGRGALYGIGGGLLGSVGGGVAGGVGGSALGALIAALMRQNPMAGAALGSMVGGGLGAFGGDLYGAYRGGLAAAMTPEEKAKERAKELALTRLELKKMKALGELEE
jgi:hypothetical protein